MGRYRTILTGLVLVGFVVPQSLIWDGDASQGKGIFYIVGGNCASPGSLEPVDDPEQGTIWRYDKPSGSDRCESRGIRVDGEKYVFQNGGTYYLGWRSRLSSTVDNNATFQWKSYGDHIQNWPVVLKMIGGESTMIQRQPDGTVHTIWSEPVRAGEWNHYVVGLHLSDETTGGWVELWLNGERQTFDNGEERWACRTFDSENDPKWGVYGAEGDAVTNDVDGLKVGTTYDDVRPVAGP